MLILCNCCPEIRSISHLTKQRLLYSNMQHCCPVAPILSLILSSQKTKSDACQWHCTVDTSLLTLIGLFKSRIVHHEHFLMFYAMPLLSPGNNWFVPNRPAVLVWLKEQWLTQADYKKSCKKRMHDVVLQSWDPINNFLHI